jgi:ribosomal protein L20
MANPNPPKNLKPRLLTDEDRRKGTAAANASKRRKKQLREMIEMMLTMPIRNGAVKTPKSMASLKNANVEVFTAMLAVQCQKALKGDTKAFTAVVNVIKDNINININTEQKDSSDVLLDTIKFLEEQEISIDTEEIIYTGGEDDDK